LELAERLAAANPDSAAAARDVVVSRFMLSGFFEKQGDSALAEKQSRACYEVLRRSVSKGMTFDPPVVRLYEKLRLRFGETK
jgi:hypothetical protein